ncbi:MAG: hypothetical protein NVSMB47_21300 [Polyangiales bacterium]
MWVFAAWAGACSASTRPPRTVDPAAGPAVAATPLAHEQYAVHAPAPLAPLAPALALPLHELPTRSPSTAPPSPLSAAGVARLRAVLARGDGRRDWFAMVGVSHTASPAFLASVTGRDVRLGEHGELDATLRFFHGWSRDSVAARSGWHAVQTLGAPLREELEATRPSFAVVMLGTNDTNQTPAEAFERYLQSNVETMLRAGVVPILTTIPPRGDGDEPAALVPEVNAIIRAVAQARQVPLIDLFGALDLLPDGGLAGDGVHMQVHTADGWHGCWLDDDSLQAGMNRRNLLTLEALDRMRRFVLSNETAEGAPAPLDGLGTWSAPLRVDAIPFADDRDSAAGEHAVAAYACARDDRSGGEVVYTLDLAAQSRLRLRVYGDAGVDVALHWLDDDAGACTTRAQRTVEVTADAGPHRFVVDGPGAREGKFRLTIVAVDG